MNTCTSPFKSKISILLLRNIQVVVEHHFAYLFIRRPSWGLAAVVSIISLGLFLLVTGETEFNLVGFLMVMIAAALAGLRWTITQVLLQGDKNHGMNMLTHVLICNTSMLQC